MKKISIVTPAFNEENSLPGLWEELAPVLESLEMDWEWIIVDDHSVDSTPEVIKRFAQSDSRIRGLRVAKNQGSHEICLLGLQRASGDCAVLLCADGQDPPEYIARLVSEMKKGDSKVVWLTREDGRGDPFFKRQWARLYYFTMRRVFGVASIPPSGGDMVLVDFEILELLRKTDGQNINILAAVAELGFSQTSIPGRRRSRIHGKSNFTFMKNFNLLFNTLTLHSVAPIRAMTFLGFFTACLGFLYGINAFVAGLRGVPAEGWTSLVLTVLVIGGVQMIMLGVMGEYLWRTLENTRRQKVAVESEIGEWDTVSSPKPSSRSF